MIDFSLSEDQQKIAESIIAFARKELNPAAAENDKKGSFPAGTWKKCAGQKLQGLCIPAEYGGGGLTALDTAVALEALGYGSSDGGLNFSLGAHLLACTVPIWKYGREEQKQHYLPRLTDGSTLAANAMTEASSGSDVFSMQTRAEKKGSGYILNGTKLFSTNAPSAGLFLIYAVTDLSKGFHGGISAFLVEKGTRGLSCGPANEKMGLRSCPMSEIYLQDVEVESGQILGGEGSGAVIFGETMNWERGLLGALHVGTMKRLLEESVYYVKMRKVNHQSLSAHESVAHRIADMKMKLEASRLLTWKAAWNLDRKHPDRTSESSLAKLFTSESLQSVATSALSNQGGNGYMSAYATERVLRDAMAATIYSGTSDIQRTIIARWLNL